MKRLNLLESKKGRLAAFFMLYLSEGLPLGFAMVAIASQLRREGVGPADIGGFIAALFVPWSLKWVAGPLVDAIRSQRFGHKRAWILFSQLGMAATLVSLAHVDPAKSLGLLTVGLVVHNIFAALQGVAISSLAVNALPEKERTLANGVMYAGILCGHAIGGPAVLFLIGNGSLTLGFYLVTAALLVVTALIVVPMKEPAAVLKEGDPAPAVGIAGSLKAIRQFSLLSYKAFTGTRGAFAALLFCLLPPGAVALSLSLKSTLAVELGFVPSQVAQLALVGSLVAAVGTILGGMLGDKVGKKPLMVVSIFAASLPTLWLAWQLQQHGHIMPVKAKAVATPELTQALWIAVLCYQFLVHLMVGGRMAVLMDVTNPKVAATQFTAYAALTNTAVAIAASWQGKVAEAWGYPVVLVADAAIGVLCLLMLPLIAKPSAEELAAGDGRDSNRTRVIAWALAMVFLAWLPVNHLMDLAPAVKNLFGTLFALGAVASAVFLLARSTHEVPAFWTSTFRFVALLMVVLLTRPYLATWATKAGLDSSSPLLTNAPYLFGAISVIAVFVLFAAGVRFSREQHTATAAA